MVSGSRWTITGVLESDERMITELLGGIKFRRSLWTPARLAFREAPVTETTYVWFQRAVTAACSGGLMNALAEKTASTHVEHGFDMGILRELVSSSSGLMRCCCRIQAA